MKTIDNRVINTIGRAVREFGFKADMNECIDDVFADAMECIEDHVNFDYISECEVSGGHLSWDDGNGFNLEADGEFISSDERLNVYYRYENGEYRKIEWYEAKKGDYVVVYDVIDSDGQRALLVWEQDY